MLVPTNPGVLLIFTQDFKETVDLLCTQLVVDLLVCACQPARCTFQVKWLSHLGRSYHDTESTLHFYARVGVVRVSTPTSSFIPYSCPIFIRDEIAPQAYFCCKVKWKRPPTSPGWAVKEKNRNKSLETRDWVFPFTLTKNRLDCSSWGFIGDKYTLLFFTSVPDM